VTAVQRIAQRSAIIDAEMQKLALANLRYGIGAFSFVPMILTEVTVLSMLRIQDVCPSSQTWIFSISDLGSMVHKTPGPDPQT
jgi:hypothetical protein